MSRRSVIASLRFGKQGRFCSSLSHKKQIETAVKTIVKENVQPLDHWNQYCNVLLNKPNSPMVLLMGNHSAGKSTFINMLLGEKVQDTGVAPVDDGFTLIRRGDTNEEEDGPTVVGTRSHGVQELGNFGTTFVNLLKMKTRKVKDDTQCPKDLILVDSPGMIGSPGEITTDADRGYDLLKVTRWFAERADCILLMFDPNNPGTTGETLDVLTESLADMDHKFLIVMNKVDQFDNVADFARSYGALCWNLSKVVKRKDFPRIYTIFTPGLDEQAGLRAQAARENSLPVEEFEKMREEVVAQVLRAPSRQIDNMLTLLEQTSLKVYMTSKVAGEVRKKHNTRKIRLNSLVGLGVASGVALSTFSQSVPIMVGGVLLSAAMGIAANWQVGLDLNKYHKNLIANIDQLIAHALPEGHPKELKVKISDELVALLESTAVDKLPRPTRRQLNSLENVMKKQIPELREKARHARYSAKSA